MDVINLNTVDDDKNLSNELSDEYLANVSLNDPEIYGVLVRRHRLALLNFIHRNFIKERAQAEDITQEAFLKAYLNLHKFDIQRKWKAWLYKIAINSAYSYLRMPQTDVLEDYACYFSPHEDSPEIKLDLLLRKERLERAVNNLDVSCRDVLDLYYKKDLTYVEISKALGLQLSAVRTKMHRARRELLASFGRDEL